MFKQVVLMIILSILTIFFLSVVHQVFHFLATMYIAASEQLSTVFSGGQMGRLVQQALVLIVIPVVIGLFINLIYYLIKRSSMPVLMPFIWLVWLLLVGSIA